MLPQIVPMQYCYIILKYLGEGVAVVSHRESPNKKLITLERVLLFHKGNITFPTPIIFLQSLRHTKYIYIYLKLKL